MAAHRKTAARKAVNAWNTPGQLEHAATAVAMKMVMVWLSGPLVNSDSARKIHRRKPALFKQTLDVAVNSRNSEVFYFGPRCIQYLLWRQGGPGAFERLANCGPLPGVPPIFLEHLRHQ